MAGQPRGLAVAAWLLRCRKWSLPLPRTIAIGDVHGCLAPLEVLLDAVAPAPDDHFVFLGDLVDRGPDSAGVIERILKLRQAARVTVLMGNHEQMMLAARESSANLREWRLNGGDAALRSYGGVRGSLRDVPVAHWEFLERGLLPYLETDTHIFVHGCVDPDLPMELQADYMLRWERCDRARVHCSGKPIICGHTSQKSGRPLNRGYLICLDTFAHGGGPLTGMEVETGMVWMAEENGKVRREHIVEFEEG